MRRGGQVTLFVILGLLILLSLSFITWSTTQLADEAQTRQEERVRQSEQAVTALKSYLQSCVEDRVQNATQRVFLQGGVLYDDQGGAVEANEPVKVNAYGRTWPVHTGLQERSPCEDYTDTPPGYPAPNKDFDDLAQSECPRTTGPASPAYSGFLGNITMPTLCTVEMYQYQLDNRFDEASPCTPNQRLQLLSYDDNDTLAKHLSDATSDVLKSCVDENAPRVAAGDINLTGEPNVSLRVAEENVRFDAELPTKIQVGGGTPTVRTANFTYLADLPVVPLHRMLFDALHRDARNPRFNLTSFLKSKTAGARYDLNITRRPSNRIIQVIDTATAWNGEPLTFTTIIERRPSLLNQFDRSNTPFDNIIVAGNTLTLPVETANPDDVNTPGLEYQGFGADHHGTDPGDGSGPDRLRPGAPLTKTPSYGLDSSVLEPVEVDTPRVGGNGYPIRPYTWGNYTTRVTMENQGNPDDYQDIHTLVIDRPALNISFTNEGFTDGPLSIEDPVQVSVEQSEPPEAFGQSVYSHTIDVNGVTFDLDSDKQMIASYDDVETIPDDNREKGLRQPSVNVSYSALANTTLRKEIPNSINKSLRLVACRQNPDVQNPPYPYTSTPETEEYRHPCCQQDNTPAPSTKVCYNQTYDDELGRALDEFRSVTNRVGDRFTKEINQTKLDEADSVSVTRRCGGDRGNICAGEPSITLK